MATARVHYREGSVLPYDELLAALPVRRGRRVLPTITHIWVDSETSRQGGRQLWAIPKEIAAFTPADTARTAAEHTLTATAAENGTLASTRVGRRRGPALTLHRRFTLLQDRDGDPVTVPVTWRGRVRTARSWWNVPHSSPLAPLLEQHRPLLTLVIDDLHMTVGE